MAAPTSSSPPSQTQLALIAPPHPRRLPPPCWSHDETVALIDAYRDKWYSLRRGNLRANHWQEVADTVASLCPLPTGPKTAVQCRHKMEKLRKRYRNDLNRAMSRPGPISSSWVHFNRMHAMEKGTSPNSSPLLEDYENDDVVEEDDDDEELYQSIRHGVPNNGYGAKPGFGIKIPTDSGKFPSATRVVGNGFKEKFTNFDRKPNFWGTTRVVGNGYKEKIASFGPISSFGGGATKVVGNGSREKLRKRRETEDEGEAVGEMVAAVKALGDGFVRMERMKMEMTREVEAMWMEIEMKRTEMILESQQRIVEAFTGAFFENKNKKVKRMGSPKS